MRGLTLIIMLLVLSAIGNAQPWQWELLAEDYFHPTGFPEQVSEQLAVVGDFDGDGWGEFCEIVGPNVVLARRVQPAEPVRWTGTMTDWHGLIGESYPLGLAAYDLDGNGADELITFTFDTDTTLVRCFSWINDTAWTERTEFAALFQFEFPIWRADFADLDGDGRLDMVAELATLCMYPCVGIFERNDAGVWEERFGEMLEYASVLSIYHGDVDGDGDLDAAIANDNSFGDPPLRSVRVYANTDGVLAPAPAAASLAPLCGGDLNGDGDWEALARDRTFSGWQHTELMPGELLSPRVHRSWGRFDGTVAANFRVAGQQTVIGYRNYDWEVVPSVWAHAFSAQYRTGDGWDTLATNCINIQDNHGLECLELSRGDINGDDLSDLLRVIRMPDRTRHWDFLLNRGNPNHDSLCAVDGQSLEFAEDTLSGAPLLGDITGDGRAEIAYLAWIWDAPRVVNFYEIVGDISDVNFVHHPEWTDGLITEFDLIRLADLDGDGLAELIGHGQDGWESWFRRGGSWVRYENILPAQIGDYEVSFADADNDGDLDAFAGGQVWLSLSPSIMDESGHVVVASFELTAYPNPFNPSTTLAFIIEAAAHVSLKVLDLNGRTVKSLHDGVLSAGEHRVSFDGTGLPSGIYFANLSTPRTTLTRKLLLVR
ncbi:T9SS type A sorting domain-containing protein [candidate division KSB1 bacterium]|nr:T9SS type A sorting domain-containing protein [candidate division KSB1 bacterium]